VNESHKNYFQMMIIHLAYLSSRFYRNKPEILHIDITTSAT